MVFLCLFPYSLHLLLFCFMLLFNLHLFKYWMDKWWINFFSNRLSWSEITKSTNKNLFKTINQDMAKLFFYKIMEFMDKVGNVVKTKENNKRRRSNKEIIL